MEGRTNTESCSPQRPRFVLNACSCATAAQCCVIAAQCRNAALQCCVTESQCRNAATQCCVTESQCRNAATQCCATESQCRNAASRCCATATRCRNAAVRCWGVLIVRSALGARCFAPFERSGRFATSDECQTWHTITTIDQKTTAPARSSHEHAQGRVAGGQPARRPQRVLARGRARVGQRQHRLVR